jgi:hypothetical protein
MSPRVAGREYMLNNGGMRYGLVDGLAGVQTNVISRSCTGQPIGGHGRIGRKKYIAGKC